MAKRNGPRIEAFDLLPGSTIGGKYVVEQRLGAGWEGEVYRVTEMRTGIRRAAKLFYPHRNENDRALKFYAKKLDRLQGCSIVIKYVHTEAIRRRGITVTCLISEFVNGSLLRDFVRGQPGGRLADFEALHLLYALARGLEEIHEVREYHGDLHDANVLVTRRGIGFDVKLLDFYHWGRPTAAHLREDVVDLVRLFYDALGGRKRYAKHRPEIKSICRGLRHDLLRKSFPTARQLRLYLETFAWD